MDNSNRTQVRKHKVPKRTKDKVRKFLNDFLEQNEITKTELVRRMAQEYNRPDSKTGLYNKFARASFQLSEVMEIAELYGYKLEFVKKTEIEPSKNKD